MSLRAKVESMDIEELKAHMTPKALKKIDKLGEIGGNILTDIGYYIAVLEAESLDEEIVITVAHIDKAIKKFELMDL